LTGVALVAAFFYNRSMQRRHLGTSGMEIWKILHERVRYEERGPAVSTEAKKVRARKMIRELRSLGYRVEPLPAPSSSPA
jgi:hypothetical protein